MWQVHARNAAAAGVVAGHSKEMPPGRVGAQQAAVRDRFACRQPATTGRASQHERILAAHRARERRLPYRLEFVQLHAIKLRRSLPDERFDSGRIGSRAGWVAWLRAGWRGCGRRIGPGRFHWSARVGAGARGAFSHLSRPVVRRTASLASVQSRRRGPRPRGEAVPPITSQPAIAPSRPAAARSSPGTARPRPARARSSRRRRPAPPIVASSSASSATPPFRFGDQRADDVVSGPEGHSPPDEGIGHGRGGGEPLARRLAHPIAVHGQRRHHPGHDQQRRLERGRRIEEWRLVVLHVLLVGQRQTLEQRQHPRSARR
jgi:hypothetical protein